MGTLDVEQVLLCLILTGVIMLAYALGVTVGTVREKKRAERVRNNLAKSRRAS